MLTDHQLQHFRTFGFVTLRKLFTPEEVEILREEYESELDHVYADQPFKGETRYWTMMLHPRTPLYASLLEDERLCGVAEQLYGDDVIGIGTDANRYVGDTGWHPDHRADPSADCFRRQVRLLPRPGRCRERCPAAHPRFAPARVPRSVARLPELPRARRGRRPRLRLPVGAGRRGGL